jgi:hydrogenase nickel incorporation protein HypA/HybF
MHELSIAIGIVDVACEELERQQCQAALPGRNADWRVTAVHLRLGGLSGVIKEALLSAYGLACEQSPALAGSHLLVQDVHVEVFCPCCRTERRVRSIQEMCCVVCGTPSAQVVRGRELEVFALEICDEQREPTTTG